jgi:hypothetical protein
LSAEQDISEKLPYSRNSSRGNEERDSENGDREHVDGEKGDKEDRISGQGRRTYMLMRKERE